MHCFEMLVAGALERSHGGQWQRLDALTIVLPDAAEDLLEPILEPYGHYSTFYFENLIGRKPAPWAITCLDRQYALGGHVATTRPSDAGIGFLPYTKLPDPFPEDFVPGVGVIIFSSRAGLQRAATKSPIFEMTWHALQERPEDRRWLVLLDPLPEPWLGSAVAEDADRWKSRPRTP